METIIRSKICNCGYKNFTDVKLYDLSSGKVHVKLISVQLIRIFYYRMYTLTINGTKYAYCLNSKCNNISDVLRFGIRSTKIIESIAEDEDVTTVVLNENLIPNKGDWIKFSNKFTTIGIPDSKKFINTKTGNNKWKTLKFQHKSTYLDVPPDKSENIFFYDTFFPESIDVFIKTDSSVNAKEVIAGKLVPSNTLEGVDYVLQPNTSELHTIDVDNREDGKAQFLKIGIKEFNETNYNYNIKNYTIIYTLEITQKKLNLKNNWADSYSKI